MKKKKKIASQSECSGFLGAGPIGTRKRKNKTKEIAEGLHLTAPCGARCSPDGERRWPGCVAGLHPPWYPAGAREKLLLPSHCASAQLFLGDPPSGTGGWSRGTACPGEGAGDHL